MIQTHMFENEGDIDSWLEKSLALARETGSNLTFHQLPIPWAWWRHFQGLDGTDFGAKRGRNFLGIRSRLESRALLVAESGGRLLGAAPLVIWSVTLKTGLPPVRVLGFSADSVVLFYQDLLVHPEGREATVEAMIDALAAFADERALLIFLGHIPEDSPNLPALAQAVEARRGRGWKGGMVTNRYRGGVYPWTLSPLGSALEGLENAMGEDAEAKAAVRSLMERLEKQGPSLLSFQATRIALERDLQALLESHAGAERLREACEAARAAVRPGVIKYPFLKLPASVEEYQASLSSSRRYYFRRYLGKFEKAGGTIEEIPPERLDGRDVEDYLALHRERWGSDSVAVNDSTVGFHRDIAREGAGLGVFRLFFARLGDRRIAAHACFDIGDRREYFFSGRDPELEDLRAGKLLVMHTVLDAIAKGFRTYDFGYGGDEYKSEFTRTFRSARSFFLGRPGAFPDLAVLFPKYEYLVLDA